MSCLLRGFVGGGGQPRGGRAPAPRAGAGIPGDEQRGEGATRPQPEGRSKRRSASGASAAEAARAERGCDAAAAATMPPERSEVRSGAAAVLRGGRRRYSGRRMGGTGDHPRWRRQSKELGGGAEAVIAFRAASVRGRPCRRGRACTSSSAPVRGRARWSCAATGGGGDRRCIQVVFFVRVQAAEAQEIVCGCGRRLERAGCLAVVRVMRRRLKRLCATAGPGWLVTLEDRVYSSAFCRGGRELIREPRGREPWRARTNGPACPRSSRRPRGPARWARRA